MSMTAERIYRAPVESWPAEPEPTTVRRWPVRLPLDAEHYGYHDPMRGGRRFVPAAVILRREACR